MNNHHFHRSRPAHHPPILRHNTATILLVTVCTRGRRDILAAAAERDALVNSWREADRWVVGYYLIMPNHVHVFCGPACWNRESIQRWVGYWKRLVGNAMPELNRVFQKDCWDRQIRDAAHYRRKLDYVAENPVRAGLVAESTAWPYQGRLTSLVWIGGR